MADFLLELLSEEIPARMQDKAREDLARLFAAELDKAGLKAEAVETFATPRRLTLIARGLPVETAAVSEELKGPRVSAPDQAIDGFLRKTGLTREALTERDGVWFAVIEKAGRATADVIAEAVPAVIRAFPWPKSMRWGNASSSTESLRWVRPLQGVIALLGGEVVPFEVAGLASGRETVGHRFLSSGPIAIEGAGDYAQKLRAAHVIVDQDERRAIIRDGAAKLAREAGLELIEDEGLVSENAGLTEWPAPLLGRFDADFLSVPPEVIQLTARVNQKYFVCRDADGKLANAFVCTANLPASDGGVAIVEGNRKVLAARLSDARFFYETDLKVPLEKQAEKLSNIVFHEKLGTVADKVDRVAKLARWLVEEGIVKGADPALAERAARLAKADLVTGMVGEFPELQGLMGGYYAAAQGEPKEVAEAIRDHYKPVGQGDDVPTAPVTVAVSLADKLDTLTAFFAIEERPTGSKDPYALRRAANGVLQIIIANQIRMAIRQAMMPSSTSVSMQFFQNIADKAKARVENDRKAVSEPSQDSAVFLEQFREKANAIRARLDAIVANIAEKPDFRAELLDFFADRLKVQQREAGVRHDLIDAVFALGGEDDLVRLLARVKALQAFIETEDGANLLAGYRRAANILKKEGAEDAVWSAPNYAPEPAEAALIGALDAAGPRAAAAVEAEDFAGAMAALATLRAPIDAFFDDVTVNDANLAKRAARLALLARIRNAVHRVADFSRIEK
ncbi:MAG: glycine--tRNA ligase subunit beta [Sphingomonas sanxanigenens]|uniref:Glycine--tRNA ligase beta subunit n=1 Tax=Sphingomonas sanxanigenens TaxID=397260 RepID=A0A2W5AC18_9SPHN|nr:MAG: glycine--tRNA ligase subunit beta [Sphingomonas sanxanigenens]